MFTTDCTFRKNLMMNSSTATPGPQVPQRRRLRFSPHLGSGTMSHTEMTAELEELKKENAQLEEELQHLREQADTLPESTDDDDRKEMEILIRQRTELSNTFSEMQKELRKIQADTQSLNMKNSRFPEVEVMTAEQLHQELWQLQREEAELTGKIKTAIAARKEELKGKARENMQAVLSEIAMSDQDVKGLTKTIEEMQSLRGGVAISPKVPKQTTDSPTRGQSMKDRISTVNHEVATLEDKCRTLKRFVAMRSPDRMRRILIENEITDMVLSIPRM